MSQLTYTLGNLQTAVSTTVLHHMYVAACELFKGDDAALFAIREATVYAKERLQIEEAL